MKKIKLSLILCIGIWLVSGIASLILGMWIAGRYLSVATSVKIKKWPDKPDHCADPVFADFKSFPVPCPGDLVIEYEVGPWYLMAAHKNPSNYLHLQDDKFSIGFFKHKTDGGQELFIMDQKDIDPTIQIKDKNNDGHFDYLQISAKNYNFAVDHNLDGRIDYFRDSSKKQITVFFDGAYRKLRSEGRGKKSRYYVFMRDKWLEIENPLTVFPFKRKQK